MNKKIQIYEKLKNTFFDVIIENENKFLTRNELKILFKKNPNILLQFM